MTKITKDKLLRLRNLYIDQLYRLKHVLREKRRTYLHTLRAERDTLCSIHVQPKETIRERKLYEKLKALNKYHKRNGVEAILYKKYIEKRQRSRDGVQQVLPPKPSFHTRCIFTEGGVKCGDRIIPCSKYCRKHILEDKKQVLFRACNVERGSNVCKEPIANILEDSTCILHIQLPPQRNYVQKKYESGSEDENETINSNENDIKRVQVKEEVDDEATNDVSTETQDKQVANDRSETNVTICHDTASDQSVDDAKPSQQSAVEAKESQCSNDNKAMEVDQ